ncbi:isocitrate/isopropylmalate dehydrogenase family protein [Thalassospira xiamenensis]|uniref:3-isopropylmalate dehydrogenase n=1 Tax=Thalassospira xiamenensis TaxID=220697 RepID=A0A367X9G5_9PROT|nr:isocitrate/isopropylmalate family dehydrogenase [Thalassospira xiamenensis]KZB55881.1 3-isopropylmalate dehydrogenase [Thalassospira xiamenensis]RCK50099.1 3-isopropylmalate dehydrogenase [Thalassospira xiamenensis]
MDVLLLPGDGIGPEITAVTRNVLEALDRSFSLGLKFTSEDVGFASLEKYGATITPELIERARKADLTILGPVDTAHYPPADQGGINPSAALRINLDLYANVRPSKVFEGLPALARNMDLVIVRENTEGFYADRTMYAGTGEVMPTPDLALAMRKVTRQGSYRVSAFAARLAAKRRGHLTIVHKANVLKLSDGLFLSEAEKAAAEQGGLTVREEHVDAMASLLVRTPDAFDVIVTTNMFGDILSNEAAELAGGLGLSGSLNVGDENAIAQASHGSAPDIAGKNIANPVSLLLSTVLLLDWKGAETGRSDLQQAANRLDMAIAEMLKSPDTRTADLAGSLSCSDFGSVLVDRLR